jgi:hypothetical protein
MICGWEGTPSAYVCRNPCITGKIVQDATPHNHWDLPPPACGAPQADVVLNAGTQTLSTAVFNPYCVHRMKVNSGAGPLVLRGAAGGAKYVVDQEYVMNANNGTASLRIDDSAGPVYLWYTGAGSAPVLNGKVVVDSGNPSNFWLIYNGSLPTVNNANPPDNVFTGIIFFPNSRIDLNYKVTGRVLAGSVFYNGNNGWVHPGPNTGPICW